MENMAKIFDGGIATKSAALKYSRVAHRIVAIRIHNACLLREYTVTSAFSRLISAHIFVAVNHFYDHH